MTSIKLPFRVSARTARLIGRENVATAKGAIIELVKNGYDADSKVVVVFIDNFYAIFHNELDPFEYKALISKGIDESMLEEIYTNDTETKKFKQKDDVSQESIDELKLALRTLAVIYIIDNGDGMTQQIIRDYWMTIGTDNKASNTFTYDGRVKVGAKGIGRFALDKLGDVCEMITYYNPKRSEKYTEENFKGYCWTVNWNDFEDTSKTIDNVNATLDGIEGKDYADFIHEFHLSEEINDFLNKQDLSHGTILRISSLRDVWDNEAADLLFDDLGVLLPPSESNEFTLYLSTSNSPKTCGKVENSVCDDYDYKLVAHADEYQNVHIRIYRNENDVEAIPASFFKRNNQQKEPYTEQDFRRGYWETQRTFRQLCPGYYDIDIDHVFNNVGKFDFTFYYLKKTTTTNSEKRFFYRPCAYNLRASWLNKYGGIKLFRDNFRVRPYGERQDSAFDWLGLGARKARSPAGIAKKDGGYKVEPENIAGLIKISRLTNVDFDDKSSREGLQENKTFRILQELTKGIISIFEDDRSCIARELDADDRDRNGEARMREDADKLVAEILKKQQEQQGYDQSGQGNYTAEQSQIILLAETTRRQQEELEQMFEEQKMLRALASTGLMLASFSHDLTKLKDTLDSRYDDIAELLSKKVSRDYYDDSPIYDNPYALLDRAKKTDIKIQNWLGFAIGAIKKDKRKRRDIRLEEYFETLKQTWASVFQMRGITFDTSKVMDITMRAFEIDFDSIFHNLFSNSLESFYLMKVNRKRIIDVSVSQTDKTIIMEYHDSGVGLSDDIAVPEDIFKPFFTTRRNTAGEEIGTGLGMWILKSVAEDNDAKISLLNPEFGFGIRFVFPLKYNK